MCLEFAPWTSLPDVASTWEVVRRADHPNGGLLIDTWHFFRGNSDLSVLDRIPPTKVASIQFTDGPEKQPGMDPFDETVKLRRPPGEGAFDLVAFVHALDERGIVAPLSLEVISDEMRALDPRDAVRRMVHGTRSVLERAANGAR
jgi:sugar phosphate isomerase/epimerase